MEGTPFIQVILPLRLGWEPYYSCGVRLDVGDRVRVPFSGREDIGVVSAVDVTPSVPRVLPVKEPETGMERILPEEIAFWRRLSSYYLCPVGEIYRAAHPLQASDGEERAALRQKQREERLAARREKTVMKLETLKRRLSENEEALKTVRPGTKRQAALQEAVKRLSGQIRDTEAAVSADAIPGGAGLQMPGRLFPDDGVAGRYATETAAILKAFQAHKTVLLCGGAAADRASIYRALALDVLSAGRNVLWLSPDAVSARSIAGEMGDRAVFYDTSLTMAARRQAAETLRHGDGWMISGTRTALLLPLRNLGLVIVENEHERIYKLDNAPRYHARDAALILAKIQGADALLGSATPSLDSLYNARSGRFAEVQLPVRQYPVEMVDITAEKRKRGVRGDFSFKMLSAIRSALEQGREVCVLTIWKDPENLIPAALEAEFPGEERISCMPLNAFRKREGEKMLIVLMHGEALLSREDFRADERSLQILSSLARTAPLLVQSKNTEHPVFRQLLKADYDVSFLMEEREALAYPPFMRMIRLTVTDSNEKRLALMASRLSRSLAALPGHPRLTGPITPAHQPDVRHILLLLPRTPALEDTKNALLRTVSSLEKDARYTGHIFIDVDPVK